MTDIRFWAADKYIRMALEEDITDEDISTDAVVPDACPGSVQLIAKGSGVMAGLPVFARVFSLLDPETECRFSVQDGARIEMGQVLGTVSGNVRVLLAGERTALNYLQRMSGIATYTDSVVQLLRDSGIRLLDTRKTTPCMRLFEKYAVRIGGGHNHRFNLSDGILLKDNHIDAAGSVTAAVQAARRRAPFGHKIEIETETLSMVREAADAGADIILLDNMSPELMEKAIRIIGGRTETECSGNVTKENIEKMVHLGVDYISSGALTHSAPSLDLSMKHLCMHSGGNREPDEHTV